MLSIIHRATPSFSIQTFATLHTFTCPVDGMPEGTGEFFLPTCQLPHPRTRQLPPQNPQISVISDHTTRSLVSPSISTYIVLTKDVDRPVISPSLSGWPPYLHHSRSCLWMFPTALQADLCLALPLIQPTIVLLSPLVSTWIHSPCLVPQEPWGPIPSVLGKAHQRPSSASVS